MAPSTGSYSPESWEYARGYAGLLGQPPSSFSTVIRGLVQDHLAKREFCSGNPKYFLLRLLKSRSLLAPMHAALCAFDPDEFTKDTKANPEEIVKTFTTFELAYMLALVYLARKAKHICDPDEWEILSKLLNQSANAGYLAGRAIPPIGSTIGLMEGSIRFLGLSTFLKHDMKGFKDYRREVKKKGGDWEELTEYEKWGCNSLQIASVLIQSMGFGIPCANAYINAFSIQGEVGDLATVEKMKQFKMSSVWRNLMLAGISDPKFPLPAKFYPDKGVLTAAMELFKNLESDPALGFWLDKTKDDLPEDGVLTPTASSAGAPALDGEISAEEMDHMIEEADEALV